MSIINISLPFFSRRATHSSSDPSTSIKLDSVPIHRVETLHSKPARTLKHLIKANHANHSVIYHDLRFHNHAPHILGSAYILGGTSEHLNAIYAKEDTKLEPWHDAPSEISKEDWRDFLGKRNYQRAYIDFFEDQLVQYGYDWEKMLHDFLYAEEGEPGKEGFKGPLINNMISGLGHPLIHLGYAVELHSKTVAIEALTLVACFYDDWHKYLDDPKYTKAVPDTKPTPLELLHKAEQDKQFDGMFSEPGGDNLSELFEKKEDALLEYWNAWELHPDPKDQFHLSQRAAVAILVGTHDASHQYDFFFCHLLTTSHAVRILLPAIESRWHKNLVRQWWLFTASVYIAQTRPRISEASINDVKLDGRDWKWVDHHILTSKWSMDAHHVKAARAMKEAAATWGDKDQFFMKAAVKFVSEFNGWGGFSAADRKAREERLSKTELLGTTMD
ncbi:hypothetical protein NA57DRAFT_38115 [Rhizodiscina lignyota]|uniref:MGS207 protein n=1 Tax=Rhizodiscina lignyota TaxID=1504668 RepID=A0A9P4IGY9_9PEZI|nr:hypothetical protein NA57DRAFT_38115 [Rhizodiscina lignyota]